ncbi:MAG: hypothetical protein ACK40G_10570 [Cytophagaceae bacterium]
MREVLLKSLSVTIFSMVFAAGIGILYTVIFKQTVTLGEIMLLITIGLPVHFIPFYVFSSVFNVIVKSLPKFQEIFFVHLAVGIILLIPVCGFFYWFDFYEPGEIEHNIERLISYLKQFTFFVVYLPVFLIVNFVFIWKMKSSVKASNV